MSQEGFVMGEFGRKNLNSGTAGYVDYGSSGGLEVTYITPRNIGLGLRWSGTYYGMDMETYESGFSGDAWDYK